MKAYEEEIARIDREIAALKVRRQAFVDAIAMASGNPQKGREHQAAGLRHSDRCRRRWSHIPTGRPDGQREGAGRGKRHGCRRSVPSKGRRRVGL
jgi:hypothetical protein